MKTDASPSNRGRVGRFLLRPAVFLWALLALGMMGLVIGDIFFPRQFERFGRLLSHRDNFASPEWRASLGAEARITPGTVVAVDSDNRVFFFTLRYRLYPIPVVWAGDLDRFAEGLDGDTVTRVIYRSGELRVEGGTTR